MNLGLPPRTTALLELAFDAGSPIIENTCASSGVVLLFIQRGNNLKITNIHNVPETLVKLAKTNDYSKNADYSVTEIISPPRIQRLRKIHFKQMQTDVSDMLWQMLGTALHNVAEKSQVKNHINEERLVCKIEGVTLSGAIDVQIVNGNKVSVIDYKFCSSFSVTDIKPEWETQLNIYGWLINKVKGLEVDKLQICALIRDWTRSKLLDKYEYPKAPIQVLDIPVWDLKKTEDYISSRIRLHKESKLSSDLGEELPLCSDEERWQRPTKYAVMKKGAKRAVKLFDDLEVATKVCNEKKEGDFYVEQRKGEPIRCTGNYCGVAEWCSQFKKTALDKDVGAL